MNLKKLRSARGMTQKQLADRMETTQQTVARWENEKTSLNADHIRQLCAILECTARELMGWDDMAASTTLELDSFGDPFGTLKLGFTDLTVEFPIDEIAEDEVSNFLQRQSTENERKADPEWLVTNSLTRQVLFINPSAILSIGLVSDEIEAMPDYPSPDTESDYTETGVSDEDDAVHITFKNGSEAVGTLSDHVATALFEVLVNGHLVPSGAMLMIENEDAGHTRTFVNLDNVAMIKVPARLLAKMLSEET